MKNRREFVMLLGGAAAWPISARAQQSNSAPVIGLLGTTSRGAEVRLVPFRQALKEAGYVEGQNLSIEYRWVENQYDRYPTLAADLVRHEVTMIVSLGGTPGALAAKAATDTIPIIFQMGSDPVKVGLVASLNRPGGNITGVSQLLTATVPKQLQLLHEVVPWADKMAFLLNQANPLYSDNFLKEMQAAAATLGSKLYFVHASAEREFEPAFAEISREGARGLVVGPDLFFLSARTQLVALASAHALPVIYPWREGAISGGLMSYASSQSDTYRQVGLYAARVLKGDKPADLPVQQSIKVELILNIKTAQALGLSFPITLQATADEVIE